MQQPLANGIEHGKIIHKRFLQTAFRQPESGGREKGAIIAETACSGMAGQPRQNGRRRVGKKRGQTLFRLLSRRKNGMVPIFSYFKYQHIN